MAINTQSPRRGVSLLIPVMLLLVAACGEHKDETDSSTNAGTGSGSSHIPDTISYGDTTGTTGTGGGSAGSGLSSSDASALGGVLGDGDVSSLLSLLGGMGNSSSPTAAQSNVGGAMKILAKIAGDGRFSDIVLPVLQAIGDQLKQIKASSPKSFWMAILKRIKSWILRLLKQVISMLLGGQAAPRPDPAPDGGGPVRWAGVGHPLQARSAITS